MDKKGLAIFIGIPLITITSLLFINNTAFLGGQDYKNMVNVSQSSESASQTATVTDVNFIPLFFNTIKEKNMNVLFGMLDPTLFTSEDDVKAWQNQFKSITDIEIKSVEPANQSAWTDTQHEYKVVLSTKMTPESKNAQIPYYGWAPDGENTKWLTLVKGEDGLWRVHSIGSGI